MPCCQRPAVPTLGRVRHRDTLSSETKREKQQEQQQQQQNGVCNSTCSLLLLLLFPKQRNRYVCDTDTILDIISNLNVTYSTGESGIVINL